MIFNKIFTYVLCLVIYVILVALGDFIINAEFPCLFDYLWNIILNLILSLISAYIFYYITVCIPFRRKCKKHRPILRVWLTDMDNEIRYAVSLIPTNVKKEYCQRDGLQFLTLTSVSYILSNSVWETKVSLLDSNVSIKRMMEFYMDSIRTRLQSILNIYAEILSDKEIEIMNEILKSKVYTRLHFVKRHQCKSKDDTIFIANEIQEILDDLSYCEKSLNSKFPSRS